LFRILFFLLVILFITACGSSDLPQTANDLPAGDATRGAALFTQSINGAPACSSCHTVDGTALVGPSLQGFEARASTRVDGQSAAEYAYQSIIHPSAYIVSGYGNLMYNQYAQHLSAQQIADLMAYILSR
jgi:cytochrome c553